MAASWITGAGASDQALDDYTLRTYETPADEAVLDVLRKFLLSDHFRYGKE